METEHVVTAVDARDGLRSLPDDSVELVVTSPPYPMIEMWDELFETLDPVVGDALAAGDGDRAFRLMHETLAPVWTELARVLVPGGIACVNVGDATRTVGGEFALYPNHTAITDRLRAAGLSQLPGLLWHKPVNRATKFMGSGMLPPNAYPTLEHEHVLLFRNGGTRSLPPGSDERYEAAYFWEERNEWFSDRWRLAGEGQTLSVASDRERSGAFPLALPLRLVRMFSTYGDRVCDPFWGTGTTTLAAMYAARDSVGFELDAGLVEGFEARLDGLSERSHERTRDRLARHAAWAAERDDLGYEAEHHEFRVMTRQERRMRPYAVETVDVVETAGDGAGDVGDAPPDTPVSTRYSLTHVPVEF